MLELTAGQSHTVSAGRLDLVGGHDDLARRQVVRVGDRVVEDADAPRDLADLTDLIGEVRRVSDNHLGLGHLWGMVR
jgi:hypothetical protein